MQSCDTCQRIGPTQVRFKATLSTEENPVLGEVFSAYLMFLDEDAVLHVVDTATRFSEATFLDKSTEYTQSVESVWLAFLETWCTQCSGIPDRLRTDAGSVFTSSRWKQLTKEDGIKLRISGVEAHNSVGIGERLHASLRRIYRKVKSSFPHLSKHALLKLAVKAMNDTSGENGLVPLFLVFEIFPRLPIISHDLPNQEKRVKIMVEAQMEMNAIVAEKRISTALSKNVPAAADRNYHPGEEVLVYRKKEKEWVGPFTVISFDEKLGTMENPEKSYRGTFNVQEVEKYFRDLPKTDARTAPSEFF